MDITEIYNYTDVKEYLRWFRDAKKKIDSGFTNYYICFCLGQKKSRSYFNNVITGRVRIGTSMVKRFISLLELPTQEALYFRALVTYSQATDSVEKDRYFNELLLLNRSPRREMDQKAFRYYTEWYHAVVRSLLDIVDCSYGDIKSIAELMVITVSKKKIRESLTLLTELELIEENEEGFLKPTDKSVRCGNDIQKKLIRQYQIKNLKLSTKIISDESTEPQKMSSLTMSVSSKALAEIRTRIDQFREEVHTIVNNDLEPADNLYQTNIHLFPLMRTDND